MKWDCQNFSDLLWPWTKSEKQWALENITKFATIGSFKAAASITKINAFYIKMKCEWTILSFGIGIINNKQRRVGIYSTRKQWDRIFLVGIIIILTTSYGSWCQMEYPIIHKIAEMTFQHSQLRVQRNCCLKYSKLYNSTTWKY